jgi:hypothetical protein
MGTPSGDEWNRSKRSRRHRSGDRWTPLPGLHRLDRPPWESSQSDRVTPIPAREDPSRRLPASPQHLGVVPLKTEGYRLRSIDRRHEPLVAVPRSADRSPANHRGRFPDRLEGVLMFVGRTDRAWECPSTELGPPSDGDRARGSSSSRSRRWRRPLRLSRARSRGHLSPRDLPRSVWWTSPGGAAVRVERRSTIPIGSLGAGPEVSTAH